MTVQFGISLMLQICKSSNFCRIFINVTCALWISYIGIIYTRFPFSSPQPVYNQICPDQERESKLFPGGISLIQMRLSDYDIIIVTVNMLHTSIVTPRDHIIYAYRQIAHFKGCKYMRTSENFKQQTNNPPRISLPWQRRDLQGSFSD